ncbi:SOS response-associated protein YedK [Roseobacter fucihabitans]|uniref:Abasic site processing protein n=1 Tax=Roseobacter fucihabitans TaxID=1537242 RepID=A0ABZ2BXV0_9RHOB|nr:SOS response-associated peptidase [Roseobacter litoralis]MBC6965043.1 putative SOS response-associated peptidase YedK [Roseobacter litoralis]
MCGRLALTLPSDAMAQMFGAQPGNDLPSVPNYNICPTDQIHVVCGALDGPRRLTSMRWGFVPHWYKTLNDGPLLINARAETIAEKPAFSQAARRRRALVIASGFYEWTKSPDGQRNPWYMSPAQGDVLVMAAIWQEWQNPEGEALRSCALVTTAANRDMAKIHHRMPVIVQPEDWPLWLGEAGHGAARLMRATDEGGLKMHRVDRAVNSNRAAGSALIVPLVAQSDAC